MRSGAPELMCDRNVVDKFLRQPDTVIGEVMSQSFRPLVSEFEILARSVRRTTDSTS